MRSICRPEPIFSYWKSLIGDDRVVNVSMIVINEVCNVIDACGIVIMMEQPIICCTSQKPIFWIYVNVFWIIKPQLLKRGTFCKLVGFYNNVILALTPGFFLVLLHTTQSLLKCLFGFINFYPHHTKAQHDNKTEIKQYSFDLVYLCHHGIFLPVNRYPSVE